MQVFQNKYFKQIVINLVLSILISLTFLIPDYLFSFFYKSYVIEFSQLEYFIIFFFFGFFLVSSKSKFLLKFVFILFGVMELTQFSHYAYYDTYIDPFAIGLMFLEFKDVFSVAKGSFFSFFYVPLVVVVPYLTSFFIIKKTWDKQFKIKFITILVVLILIFPAVRIPTLGGITRVFPYKRLPTLANSLNSYSAYFSYFLPKKLMDKESKKFKPYEIEKIRDIQEPTTIVIVMGESFSYKRMSIFGAKRETTPTLEKIIKDKRFAIKKAISSGTATRASLPAFFNIQYNPLNRKVIEKKRSNIFKLAKDAGFKTFYVSVQPNNTLTSIGIKYIDKFIPYDSIRELVDKKSDDALLTVMKQLSLSNKNLIVLHQNNIHAEYEKRYGHRKEFFVYPINNLKHKEKMKNSYDNGVLYNDFLWSNFINYYRKNVHNNLYMFLTSDHSEGLGEDDNYWGHGKLAIGSVRIPLVFYSSKKEDIIREKIRKLDFISHYEIGVLIANALGYEIKNPNIEKDIYYCGGCEAFGDAGYMTLKKDKSTKETNFKVNVFFDKYGSK